MRFRGFVTLLAVPTALAVAASCAPVSFGAFDFGGSANPGAGGDSFAATGSSSNSGGGGGLGITGTAAGTGGYPTNPAASFEYLCGGAGASCVPGPQDDCAKGGNPGMGGAPAGGDAGTLSCKVLSSGGGVAAQCVMAGGGADGDPCMKATDCGAELGCIAGLTPTCRTYCCASLESCPANTYCVAAPMNEAQQSQIPVCIPVTQCALLDNTGCTGGQVCAIVRQDGTTSCVDPGTGTLGQPCPCADGYSCNTSDGTCLKLCHIGGNDCGDHGYCQGGVKPYPKDIGYCVYYP